jgi:7-carboxy-7-deazaguanine synthase
MTTEEILEQAIALAGDGIRHVVVTGGEPMIFDATATLCALLFQAGFTITIETAGTVFRDLPCNLMSISPKLANSDPHPEADGVAALHAKRRYNPAALTQLLERYDCQLKFVVNPEVSLDGQLEEIESLLAPLPHHRHPVLLMPEGTDVETLRRRESLLIPVCTARGWRLSARRHIEWFGNTRGT